MEKSIEGQTMKQQNIEQQTIEQENAEQQPDIVADEKENFDAFISAMVQIVEKYGKSVLQDLDCVA